jgi:hypothetical protein
MSEDGDIPPWGSRASSRKTQAGFTESTEGTEIDMALRIGLIGVVLMGAALLDPYLQPLSIDIHKLDQ